MVCSCSFHVLNMAALIHIIRSVRAGTFNDYIHMHLVPYLKSQIIPSAHDEVTLPSGHRIRNSQSWRLQCSTQYLRMLFASERGRNICFFETWMPERGTNPRSPDFSSRTLYNHCISPSPKSLQLGVHQFRREISKNVCKKTKKEVSFLLL